MALFQQSVLRKYTSELPKDEIAAKWQLFQSLFYDPVKQQNFRAAKEEQYQEGFLRELLIAQIDKEINAMVYKLYELIDEDIAII